MTIPEERDVKIRAFRIFVGTCCRNTIYLDLNRCLSAWGTLRLPRNKFCHAWNSMKFISRGERGDAKKGDQLVTQIGHVIWVKPNEISFFYHTAARAHYVTLKNYNDILSCIISQISLQICIWILNMHSIIEVLFTICSISYKDQRLRLRLSTPAAQTISRKCHMIAGY